MADRQTKALMIYLNNREVLEALDDAERGRMTLALMDYLESGTLPAFTGAMQMAFIVLRKDVDRSEARWNEECARRSAAGKKSAAVRAAKNFTQEVSCENDSEEAESDSPISNAAEPGAADGNRVPECSTNLSSVQPCSTALSSVQHGSTDATYTNTNTNSNTNTNANTNTKIRNQSLSAAFDPFGPIDLQRIAGVRGAGGETCSLGWIGAGPAGRKKRLIGGSMNPLPSAIIQTGGLQRTSAAYGKAGQALHSGKSAAPRKLRDAADSDWLVPVTAVGLPPAQPS